MSVYSKSRDIDAKVRKIIDICKLFAWNLWNKQKNLHFLREINIFYTCATD